MLESDVQDWLDKVSDYFFADDFDGYAASVAVPFTVTTSKAKVTLDTEEALRGFFENWRDMLASLRVTQMVRTSRSVVTMGPDHLECHYDTQLLSGTSRVAPPYRGIMKLERSGSGWRAVSVVSDVNLSIWPMTIPQARAAQ